jgi:hypothetical protein
MKRQIYDLTDEEFGFFANHIGRTLANRDINHLFVGGTAVQAHILSALCKKYNCTIEDLVLRDNPRLQDCIRATDDIDMIWNIPGSDEDGIKRASSTIFNVLDSLEGEYLSPSNNHLLKYNLQRKGIKKPIFYVEKDGRVDRDASISLNISRDRKDLLNLDEKYHNLFLEDAVNLAIPFSSETGYHLQLRTINPNYLLATKISNFRAKDVMDLQNLTQAFRDSGFKIDYERIKDILTDIKADNFEKYISLVGSQ